MTAALANLSRQFSHSSSGKSSLGRRHGSRFSLSRFSNSRQRSRLGPQQRPLIQKQGSHEGAMSHQQPGSEAAAADRGHAAEVGQHRQEGAKQVTLHVANVSLCTCWGVHGGCLDCCMHEQTLPALTDIATIPT